MSYEQKKKKMVIFDQTARKIVLIISILFSIILCIDFFNIPTRIGLNVGNFNSALVSFFFNSLTAVLIFFLTYIFVERWNVNNRRNKCEVALFLLKKTYQNCISDLDILHGFAIPILVEKTDFDKLYKKNSPADKYAETAFENDEKIMKYAEDGIINAKHVEMYLKIKNDYFRHVGLCITFHDAQNLVTPKYEYLKREIEDEIISLSNQAF